MEPGDRSGGDDRWVLADWLATMRSAVEDFGSPIFGLTGPMASDGVVNGYGGQPTDYVTLLYHSGDTRIEVTTSSRPRGGTHNLVSQALHRATPQKPHLPWTVTVTERLAMRPVVDVQTQFRVVEASTGDWVAASGFKKRHLLLVGSPGTSIDELALMPVVFDFDS